MHTTIILKLDNPYRQELPYKPGSNAQEINEQNKRHATALIRTTITTHMYMYAIYAMQRNVLWPAIR